MLALGAVYVLGAAACVNTALQAFSMRHAQHMLLLHQCVEAVQAFRLLQVRVYPRLAIPAPLHRGTPEEGTSIYADARPDKPRHSNLAMKYACSSIMCSSAACGTLLLPGLQLTLLYCCCWMDIARLGL